MKEMMRDVGGVLAGVVLAIAITLCSYGLFQLGMHFFPAMGMNGLPFMAWLVVFALPEVIFVICTVRLWRKRKPVAVGILLMAVIFGTHFAMHIASHWRG
jgi:hypothetical protein